MRYVLSFCCFVLINCAKSSHVAVNLISASPSQSPHLCAQCGRDRVRLDRRHVCTPPLQGTLHVPSIVYIWSGQCASHFEAGYSRFTMSSPDCTMSSPDCTMSSLIADCTLQNPSQDYSIGVWSLTCCVQK